MMSEFQLRKQICQIGKGLYDRQFVAANDGNISARLSDREVLATPTGVSKGSLQPSQLAVCDLDGRQVSGRERISSEILLHLAIYQANPKVQGVVHAHPPYATAFGVANVQIPTCILPEIEIALGVVPIADYETPGTQACADAVARHANDAWTAIMKNHGVVSWGQSLKMAHFRMEMVDSYCRILMLSRQLGNVDRLSDPQVKELLEARSRYGMPPDPRALTNADLCVNTDFGRGYESSACPTASKPAAPMTPPDFTQPSGPELEKLVQVITDRVMAALST